MDLFLWLSDDWQEVGAMTGTLDCAIEADDVSMATVRFSNGALGSIVNSALSPRQETYLRLDFQRATVELRSLYKAATVGQTVRRGSIGPDDPFYFHVAGRMPRRSAAH